MTDAAGRGGTSPPPSTNVSALVEAIDVRAREAGAEGAATLLRGSLDSVAELLRTIDGRLDDMEGRLAARPEPADGVVQEVQAGLAAFNARLGRLEEAFIQAVEDSTASTQTVVDQVRDSVLASLGDTTVMPPAPAADLAERVIEAMRREAELLTQRVAALAVGVEASRALLEQHVEETENSIGRKATEVTRKLAADFGLRARRGRGSRDERDPRELGSGSGRNS